MVEFDGFCRDVCDRVRPFTLIGDVRIAANVGAIKRIVGEGIVGDVVEVGVWKGGSVLSMLLSLLHFGDVGRRVHLYDTFDGMTPSTDVDVDRDGKSAVDLIAGDSFWSCVSPLDEVRGNVLGVGYPGELVCFHVGDICKTDFVPDAIALLRLDTDWYESTRCELELFYDRVVSGGIVMVDDYGHWRGCRKAVDEFLVGHPDIVLREIDYTGRYFLKP